MEVTLMESPTSTQPEHAEAMREVSEVVIPVHFTPLVHVNTVLHTTAPSHTVIFIY